jgi:CRP-like cAMP-binding protein
MRPEDPRVLADDRRIGAVERVLLLKRIPWLASLAPDDLALLAGHGRERLWPAGAPLLRDGEPVDTAHLVLDGRIRLWRRGRVLGVAEAGASIGGTLLLARDEVGLDAVPEMDSVTLALERERLLDVLEERFAVFRSALRETCRELVALLVRHPQEAAPRPRARALAPGTGEERKLDLVDRILLLRGTLPFEASGVDALAELAQLLEEVRVAAGTLLWQHGERSDRMLFVVGGRVRCELPDRARPFHVGPGQALGGLELLAEQPRWFGAVAEEPVLALACDLTQLLDVMEDDVAMGLEVLAYLARSSVRVQERVAEREGTRPPLFACDGRCG